MSKLSQASTILLSRSELTGLVSIKEAIESIRTVFKEHELGRTKTYPRVHIPFNQYEGTIGYMEAGVDRLGASASKIVGLYHKNPETYGLPRILSLIVLSQINNGVPIAVMDGNYLTMMRTAATAGLAASYLALEDAEHLGLIGAGVQSRGQLLALKEVRPSIKEVTIYNVRRPSAELLAKEAKDLYGLDTRVANTVSDLKDCHIIASSTPSRTPLVTEELLHEGVHVSSVGIGAGLGKREVDFRILRMMKIVVEDRQVARMDALAEAYQNKALCDDDIYATLGELVLGSRPGRTGEGEETIFISSGIAILDVAVAQLAYEKAVKEGVGREYNFFL